MGGGEDQFLLGVDLEISNWTSHFSQNSTVNPLSLHSLELPVALSNPFKKLDDSASLFVKYLAQMKRWMDVLNHKKKWIPILDSLEAMTLAVIITTTTTTTTTNSPQTTGETYSVKSALAIFLPSYFCCFFQAPHMQHLPSTEFRKAELS